MFTKGSRYRNLPQSSALTADGESLPGVDLRAISPRPGTFLHTVQDSDRLDLLAYKYYNDSTMWWQICDANPSLAFPTDLVDLSPVGQQQMQLSYPDSETRYRALLDNLGAIGVVVSEESDFIEAVVAITYDGKAATRQQILGAIKTQGFDLLDSHLCGSGPAFTEAFVFNDHGAKQAWRDLLEGLGELPGILAVQSVLSDAMLTIVFNKAMVGDLAIPNLMAARGFTTSSPPIDFSRAGTAIVVPPKRTG